MGHPIASATTSCLTATQPCAPNPSRPSSTHLPQDSNAVWRCSRAGKPAPNPVAQHARPTPQLSPPARQVAQARAEPALLQVVAVDPRPTDDPRSANALVQPTQDPPADANPIPVTPSTTSVSSASTSTTNLAPSVPARSPLRGTPRSIVSFTLLLHHYVPTPAPSEPTLGLGLDLAAGIGAGWSQLAPPPASPSVYSPVRSIFQPAERRGTLSQVKRKHACRSLTLDFRIQRHCADRRKWQRPTAKAARWPAYANNPHPEHEH
ncbi:hypothetical protein FS749_009244 [Ceratobasidium sp. UAMH 11750]|nr:hypothetical protein FS749_009244 [Ceratobasidium sp. UAMH 11750]